MYMRLVFAGVCFFILLTGCGGGSSSGSGGSSTSGISEFTYKFDETSGATAVNATGGGYYNGTIYGAGRVAGKVGNALQFTNSGDRAEIPIVTLSDFIYFPSGAITIDAWIKLDSAVASSAYLIIGNGGLGTSSFQLLIYNNQVNFYLCDSVSGPSWRSIIASNQTLTVGTWYHIAVTYDGTTANVYINGALDNTASRTYPIITVYNKLFIGAIVYPSSSATYQFLGIIDELRFSKYARSASEIANYYLATM
jgi:hypothetical protein